MWNSQQDILLPFHRFQQMRHDLSSSFRFNKCSRSLAPSLTLCQQELIRQASHPELQADDQMDQSQMLKIFICSGQYIKPEFASRFLLSQSDSLSILRSISPVPPASTSEPKNHM